jgi:hypothetical protein
MLDCDWSSDVCSSDLKFEDERKRYLELTGKKAGQDAAGMGGMGGMAGAKPGTPASAPATAPVAAPAPAAAPAAPAAAPVPAKPAEKK